MWPLCLLLDKILEPKKERLEVDSECADGFLAGNDLDLLQSVTNEKLFVDRICHASVQPRSRFIDVSI